MQFKFFTIQVFDPERVTEELNSFCANHRVLTVERHFVAHDSNSFWAICVCYQEGEKTLVIRKGKIDYREVLNEKDFTLYATLRSLRKELSEKEGVPAYALFTNEQLAEIVRRRIAAPAALAEIKGVGDARVQKYGHFFIDALETALQEMNERPVQDNETNPH